MALPRKAEHAVQTPPDTSTYAKAVAIQADLTSVTGFLRSLKGTVKQLIDAQRLRFIFTRVR